MTTGGHTAVLGHRGASAHARENTVEAYRLARDQGADGVELDVRRTPDGGLLIHHDAAIDGVPLVAMETAAARSRWPWLPSLDEALDACTGMLVNVEVKNMPAEPDHDPDETVAAAVVAAIAARGLHEETIVSSFNPATTARLRALDARIRVGQLLDPRIPDLAVAVAAAAAAGYRAIHPFNGSLAEDGSSALVDAAHDAGLWVVVWTVNDPERMRVLAGAGVDGVITDDPALAVSTLRR